MSKNYISGLLFAGLMSQASLIAQPVGLKVGSVSTGCSGGQTITVPVSMSNGTNITACQFTLQWDPSVLDFIPGSGQLQGPFTTPSFSPNFGELYTASGQLTFSWVDNPGVTTGPGDVVMFTIEFDVLSLATTTIDITGSPTPIKVGQGGPPVVNQQFTLTAGTISTGDVEPPILVCPADQTFTSDDPIVINTLTPFASDDCQLQSLTYELSGATIAQDSGDASGQDLFNPGTTFLTYTAIDAAGNSETCVSTVTLNPDTLTVIAQSRTGDCGEAIEIDILVNNFDDVSTLGFTLEWDPAVLQFDSTGLLENQFISVSAADIGDFQVASGKLTFAWFDAANHSAPDMTRLFRIYFKAIGGSGAASGLTFTSNPTPQLAGSGVPTPAQIPAIWQDGTASIIDQTAPTIACPGDTLLNDIPVFPLAIGGLYPTVADNCAVDSVAYQMSGATTGSGEMPANGTLSFNEGVTTVIQTVYDAAGNEASCQFIVSLVGLAKPVFTLPVLSFECGSGDQAVIHLTVADFKNVASSDLFIGFDPTVLSIDSVGGFHAATGGSGNWFTNTAGGTIQIGFVNTPNNVGVTLNDGDTLLTIYAKAIGTAGATSLLNFTQQPTASSPGGPYTTTGQDGFVSIVDTKAPVLDGCPFDFQQKAGTDCNYIADFTPPTATDACDGSNVTITSNIEPGDTLGLGTHTVTYIAKDNANNADTCSFIIDVVDLDGPHIICPQNDTLAFDAGLCTITLDSLGEVPTYLSVSDNCTASPLIIDPTVTFPQVLGGGESVEILWTAVDDAGNATYCNFFLTAQEATPPSAAFCPGDTVVSCDAVAAFDLPLPIFDKGCGPDLTFSVSVDTSSFPMGTTAVIFTATGGNQTATCAFNVNVVDDKKPVISECPANDTLLTAGGCTAVMPNYQIQVLDNCDAVVNVEYLPTPGSQLNIGDTTVMVTATDDSGNADTCFFKITVKAGQTATFLNCPQDSTYQNTCTVLATWQDPIATGFCGTPTITESNPLNFVNLFAGLPDTISYVATDQSGNTASCTFILNAVETVPPTLDCPPAITVDVAGNILSDVGLYITGADTVAGCASVELTFGPPSADDNCIGVNLQQNIGPVSGSAFPLGTSAVYWRAMDASGNSATCSIEITVVPLDTPTIVGSPNPACLGDVVSLTTNPAFANATYSWTGPSNFTSTSPTAIIFGLTAATAGPYTVNTSVNGCPAPKSKPFTAILAKRPVAGDDPYTVEISTTLDSFTVLENDQLVAGDSYSITLQTPPSTGTLVDEGNGYFTYTAPGTAVGGVNFSYIICSETCPDLCDTAIVFITVKESTNDCAIIPKVITPNGDGFNDYWLIFCIETGEFPENSLIVFNQWGDRVYEAAPYKNDWYGTLDGETGKDLPDGTYFYIFTPGPGEDAVKGALTIFR